ncbi:MAG: NAD-dependent deacylase [Acidobacteria bacterium]|nr:NAD-dependent deacylase [Acidobacteriota bacterium]
MICDSVSSQLKARFAWARRVAVLAGAGVSAESGVPTFRGGGDSVVWRGFPFEQLSSPEMLEANPALFWEWFNYRRAIILQVKPNPAHYALADWQTRFEAFTLVTQNIDDLHHLAGSRDVLELHGNIWRARCMACGQLIEHREAPIRENLPRCLCGGILRPDVVLFGESLPQEGWQKAFEVASRCDLFFVVGTSAIVYPAAELPLVAKRSGAFLIEVNPEATPLTSIADATVLGKAGEVLPRF